MSAPRDNRRLPALASLGFPAVFSAVYFGSAGRVDLPAAWAVTASLAACGIAMAVLGDRDLMAERAAPGGANRDATGQRACVALLALHWVVSGLDAGRFGWTPIDPRLRWAGAIAYAVAVATMVWVVRLNRFYSSAVRVQAERGQVVVAAGPYRVVRHPGYVLTIGAALAAGLALGSWVGTTPLLPVVLLFVRRTHNEDRMLRDELPGYADYARRVRYRLLPGVY